MSDKPNPFDNETWVKMCLKTGAITPPRDHDIERRSRITAIVVLVAVTLGSVIAFVAASWR